MTLCTPDVISRDPPSMSVNDLIEASYLSWAEQMERVFDERSIRDQSSTNDRSGC